MPISAAFSALELAQRNMDGGWEEERRKVLFFFRTARLSGSEKAGVIVGEPIPFFRLGNFLLKNPQINCVFYGAISY